MGMVLTAYSDDEIVKYVDRSNPQVDELCNRLEVTRNLEAHLESSQEEITKLEEDLENKDKINAELLRSLSAINAKGEDIKRKVSSLLALFPQPINDSTGQHGCCEESQGELNA